MFINSNSSERSRNGDGRYRRTRNDKNIGKVEQEYSIKLGFPPETPLGFVLEFYGFESVTQLINYYYSKNN